MQKTTKDTMALMVNFIQSNPLCTSKEIHNELKHIGYATIKRLLQQLIAENLITVEGRGKSTKYKPSESYELLHLINVNTYFESEIDDRRIKDQFNHSLMSEILNKVAIFTNAELALLNNLQNQYRENCMHLTEAGYKKELERLAIDLSWKSSQIEGNTYSLLETERLLKEKETASGKTKGEAIMLLNHKSALDFIVSHPNFVKPLSVAAIEDIHYLLTQDLKIERNIRSRRVGISGTNYKPLDNTFQIKEALEALCELVNNTETIFAKALLALTVISYIQPFADGNKRTARIL